MKSLHCFITTSDPFHIQVVVWSRNIDYSCFKLSIANFASSSVYFDSEILIKKSHHYWKDMVGSHLLDWQLSKPLTGWLLLSSGPIQLQLIEKLDFLAPLTDKDCSMQAINPKATRLQNEPSGNYGECHRCYIHVFLVWLVKDEWY